MTPERWQKLERILKHRQDDLTVVMENVDDPHNISAVMRTCEAVGIQDIYILTTRIKPHKRFGNRSSSSAAKWLTIHTYTDMEACISSLRENYSRILTTHLGEQSQQLYALDLTQPTALVFGNEHDGVSEEMRSMADGNFIIPQVGIIQSLNISVACAVTLYEAYRQKERAGHYAQTKLSPQRYASLLREWGAGPDETALNDEVSQ